MSADETDSLIRAIAASPALPAPARLVSIILVETPEPVTALADVAESFGARLCARPDGVLQLAFADHEGVAQAASCALAIRAARPKAALALATGFAEAAAIERALALGKRARAGAIAIDDATVERLDASFEVDGVPSARSLVAQRTAGAGPRIGPEVVDEALEKERLAAGRTGHPMRLVGSAVMLVAVAVAHLLQPTPTRRVLLILLTPYVTYAAAVLFVFNGLKVRHPKWLPFVLLDILFFGVLAIGVSRAAPADATWAVGLATALCCMHMAGACLTLRWGIVAAATVLAIIVLTTAHLVARQPLVSLALALAVLMTTSSIARHLMRRVRSLIARVAEEAETRIRDVELLNAELRRQIADRAEQLASALSRLQTPSPSRALHAGMVLEDRYRVVRAIGRGGMGAVYEVERIADGRKLALKVLTGAADHLSLARFAREAQIAAELNHANVVSVIDVDVTRSGTLFVVMELVAGGSLASERRRYGEAAWALPILRQIAAALMAMHARGIVHRDLKPSNILLDGTTVKIADFGLVGILENAASPTLTSTGAIMGTPLYMAPELAGGARDAAPSTDVFSFGVVAYELLANTLPFAAPPLLERLGGRAAPAAQRLAHTRTDLSGEVCALVDGCLAEAPELRPTAVRLVAALEALAR